MSMTPINHSQAFLYCRMLMALLSIHQENCPKSLHSILHTPSHLIQLNSFYHSPSTSHFPNLFVHCFRRLRTRNVQYIYIYIYTSKIHPPHPPKEKTTQPSSVSFFASNLTQATPFFFLKPVVKSQLFPWQPLPCSLIAAVFHQGENQLPFHGFALRQHRQQRAEVIGDVGQGGLTTNSPGGGGKKGFQTKSVCMF